MDFKDHPLWHFTVEAHGRPGVHDACLALQKGYHIDANFLFWCCWVAKAGGEPLDEAQLERAMDNVGQWQKEIVRPVWEARWRLKPSYGSFPKALTEALRRELIGAELSAEHIELLQLADAVRVEMKSDIPASDKMSHAAKNLALYLSRHFSGEEAERNFKKSRNPIPEEVQVPLSIVLCACFPEVREEDAVQLLKKNLSS